MDPAAIERDTVELARHIADLGSGRRSRVYRMSFWSERVMDWAMSRPEFKTQLFRFVDVFPALGGNDDVARHLAEYLDGVDVPKALDLGATLADRVPLGANLEARVARRNIARMAEQFIIGATAPEAVEGIAGLWRSGRASTADLLGEKTVVEAEADRYQARVLELLDALAADAATWPAAPGLERDDLGPLPRVNISIKPTALATHYTPLARAAGLAGAGDRIRPILHRAAEVGAHIHLDMEHAEVKDLTLDLLRDLLADPALDDLSVGIVIQAYLKDARSDLADLIAWASGRATPPTVRLVKGAYWDAETVVAAANGWDSPTFEHKDQTDASFERCARLLLDHHGEVRAAFGSHNLRSLAHAITYARHRGIPDEGYEVQLLHGMAEPIHDAIVRLGLRLRVYTPVGELVPGMAYLVRRLLENTSNESFVRHRFAEGLDLDELVAPPEVDELPVHRPPDPPEERATDPDEPGPYRPEPIREWRRAPQRAAFGAAVRDACDADPRAVPALLDGDEVRTARALTSVDPGCTDRVVATSAACGPDEADAAAAAAVRDLEQWRSTPTAERAAVLFDAASRLRAGRDELAALQCVEAGKPWDQADADVCEAIDFCEYYAREALRLAGGAPGVDSPPGEANRMTYQGKGVTAVIAPWNFPAAIPCGMTVAALAVGNPAILKPAEQTPAVAWGLARALRGALADAGAPPGVFQLLPGSGEAVGARLVEHPDVAVIAFTGSREVGLAINRAAAVVHPGQRHIKRVVCELGGKNALVIDDDADLDEAVPAAVASAFGYAGQKCSAASRLILVDRIHDAALERLAAATRELVVGHAAEPATQVGPVIDADAFERIHGWIDRAPSMGRIVAQHPRVPEGGWYVAPTVVEVDDPDAPIATEEIFGPVLSVLRARDLDHALELANATPYALTAGIFSRSPANLRRAADGLRAGNVYLNRHTTGAVVGRQPFGGYGLSGIGSKAGGPDYLLQLVDPRVTTENTLRQGFEGTTPTA
jgi:RHH-type transcriptional regulator, proline utilization regulon repressor / proline dehydrogenase / delta 1-pyrroline-5-carboxylate dehydrogenase